MFEIQGVEVKQEGELINLTDIWKASGLDHKRKPSFWKEYIGGSFIDELSQKSGIPDFELYTAKRGKGAGTYAHWQIALAYAKWLSPALHMEVNETYMRVRGGMVEHTMRSNFNIPTNLKDALLLAADLEGKRAELEAKIEADRPKIEFAEAVRHADNSITIQEFAGILGIKGFGRTRIFEWLRDGGYLMSSNIPYRKFLDSGLFEVEEKVRINHLGQKMIYTQTRITGKGQVYFEKKLRG